MFKIKYNKNSYNTCSDKIIWSSSNLKMFFKISINSEKALNTNSTTNWNEKSKNTILQFLLEYFSVFQQFKLTFKSLKSKEK